MSLKINNSDEISSRIVNLDFLRGFFVILALHQHFTYYMNMWYVDFFRDTIALSSTYSVHFEMIGKQLTTSAASHWFAVVFTPWVSQVYLTMSAFNLAKRDQQSFSEGMSGKLKIFGMIYLFFVLENFIVAPNTGQAISFYPIMLWMIILMLLSFVYKFMGIKGVAVLTLLSLFIFVVPIELLSDFFQEIIRTKIHPGYEYDARIEYFILSGCLGFIMGYVHYHLPNFKTKKDFIFAGIGFALVLLYVLLGDPFTVDPADVLSTEHSLARTFTGTCYVLGIQAIVISAFLWLERKGIRFNVPVITWVGVNSILVFALHRILFVKLIVPFSGLIASMNGWILSADIIYVYTCILITLGICYFIKVSPVSDIILQKKR